VDLVSDSPAMATEEGASACAAACEILRQKTAEAVSFAADSGWFARLGLECILLGPGSIEVAHKRNEFVPIDELENTANVVSALIERFCRKEDAP